MKHIVKDMSSLRFGKLTVLLRADNTITPNGTILARWHALCDCGRYKIFRGSSLRSGLSTSCGCSRTKGFSSEWFWAQVIRQQYCWVWSRARNSAGYGHFCRKVGGHKRWFICSRVAYELSIGPIPDSMEVMHVCDNPPCVRPDHLTIGTHKDNL